MNLTIGRCLWDEPMKQVSSKTDNVALQLSTWRRNRAPCFPLFSAISGFLPTLQCFLLKTLFCASNSHQQKGKITPPPSLSNLICFVLFIFFWVFHLILLSNQFWRKMKMKFFSCVGEKDPIGHNCNLYSLLSCICEFCVICWIVSWAICCFSESFRIFCLLNLRSIKMPKGCFFRRFHIWLLVI